MTKIRRLGNRLGTGGPGVRVAIAIGWARLRMRSRANRPAQGGPWSRPNMAARPFDVASPPTTLLAWHPKRALLVATRGSNAASHSARSAADIARRWHIVTGP